MLTLRCYKPDDCHILAALFYDTVHTINRRDYTEEQVNAWADGKLNLTEWNLSFRNHNTVIAEKNGNITGFGDMDSDGYLDRLYVHKDYQHQGIATAICDVLEQNFRGSEIITHASITAKGFFEKRGYKAIKQQQVYRHGIPLINYIMILKKNFVH